MRQELKKKVGIKMRNLREERGLTQTEMVSHFDIGRANYSRIEKGEIFPNESILYTLIKKFKISLNWFIGDEGQMMLTKRKNRDFSECGEEIDDLFYHIKKIPMVKHAVLAFFLEYKQKNSKLIKKLIEEVERKEQKQKTKSPKT